MHSIYAYIIVMAGVTYLIRMLPLVLLKREIQNPFIKSFLYYVPYVTLAVMTFPVILGLQVRSGPALRLFLQQWFWHTEEKA